MVKRIRADHVKSRTGCRTCKKRRVKCDETKPCCLRCLSGDRICEGYGIVIGQPSRSILERSPPGVHPQEGHLQSKLLSRPVASLSSIPSLNYSESAAFDFFRVQIVREMSGVRSFSFWQHIVLPACYSEHAVLHASMALAHASRGGQRSGYTPIHTGDNPGSLYTVHEYNKAIQHLKSHVATYEGRSSLRVTLITCILFIALETMTNRTTEAMTHIIEGRRLLRTYGRYMSFGTVDPNNTPITLILAPDSRDLEDQIISIFADLDSQSTFFGSERPQLRLIAREDPQRHDLESLTFTGALKDFSSIHEANQRLVILTNESLNFAGDRLDQNMHSVDNPESNVRRQHLVDSLRSWQEAYERLRRGTHDTEKSDIVWKRQSAMLLLQHAWLSIVVPLSYYEVEEDRCDLYLPEFCVITEMASYVVPAEGASQGTFSLEFGLLPALWFTTMKCRHPQVRRTALDLLKRAGREGLWDPKLIWQLARECILLEEGIEALDSRSPLSISVSESSRGQHDYWKDMIPLRKRVSAVTVDTEFADSTVLIRMSFQRKVWDCDGKCIGVENIIRRHKYEG